MKKLKDYWGIMIFVLVILGAAFYWYELRPISITRNCVKKSINLAVEDRRTKDSATYLFDREHWDHQGGPEPKYIQEHLDIITQENSYYEEDYNRYYKQCLQFKGLR